MVSMYFSCWKIITVGTTESGICTYGIGAVYALQSFDQVMELVSGGIVLNLIVNGFTGNATSFSTLKQDAEYLDIQRLMDLCRVFILCPLPRLHPSQ